ncbi:MAG: hypothetical protein WC399_02885 [Bacilli bacterium]|jgi:hypothetical protein
MKISHRSLGSFLRIGLLALLPIFSGCGPLERVAIHASDTPVVAAVDLSTFAQFATLVTAEESFVVTVTDPTCTCTTEFMPHYQQYLTTNNIPGYTLRYSLVLYESEKYGLPVVDSTSPILVIYETGSLKYVYTYESGKRQHNRVFTSYDDLARYLDDRLEIIVG